MGTELVGRGEREGWGRLGAAKQGVWQSDCHTHCSARWKMGHRLVTWIWWAGHCQLIWRWWVWHLGKRCVGYG